MVSAYEREREQNIERNKRLFLELDLKSAVDSLGRTTDTKSRAGSTSKRKRSNAAPQAGPPRKSIRLAEQRGTAEVSQSPVRSSSSPQVPHSTSQIVLRNITTDQISNRDVDPATFLPEYRAPLPARDDAGVLHFEAPYSDFTPNLTPSEVLEMGAFGGTFFRPFYSHILNQHIPADYDEFPEEWFHPRTSGQRKPDNIVREEYDSQLNFYGVKAGQSLEEWEKNGWVRPQDPRGWFQWYCRFYLGRRSVDDDRQIKRWRGVCGPSGRFKRSLVKKIAQTTGGWDNADIAPVLRQTLQHWACKLIEEDYESYFT